VVIAIGSLHPTFVLADDCPQKTKKECAGLAPLHLEPGTPPTVDLLCRVPDGFLWLLR